MKDRMAVDSRNAHRIRVGHDEVRFLVTGDQSEGAVLAFEVRMPAGGGPPVLHRHDPFEAYLVQGGELAVYLEDERGIVERIAAAAGTVVAIPGGREHTVRNESGAQARALVVFAPGPDMERFVRAAGTLGARGAPRPAELVALAETHGITMTRPLAEVAPAVGS